MKRVISFLHTVSLDPALFFKDHLALARSYLIVPNRTHRYFSLATMIGCAVLIGLFLVYAFVEKLKMTTSPLFGNPRFAFIDWGYPETFGYLLEFFCIGIFTLHALVHKKKHWLAWSAIFVIVLLDDSIGGHEVLGRLFFGGDTLSPVMGEIAVFAVMGLMFAVLWMLGVMTMPYDETEFSAYLLFTIYFAALTAAGVGIDGLHVYMKQIFHVPDTLLTLAEDGSELVLTGLIAISALGMWYRHPAIPAQAT